MIDNFQRVSLGIVQVALVEKLERCERKNSLRSGFKGKELIFGILDGHLIRLSIRESLRRKLELSND